MLWCCSNELQYIGTRLAGKKAWGQLNHETRKQDTDLHFKAVTVFSALNYKLKCRCYVGGEDAHSSNASDVIVLLE